MNSIKIEKEYNFIKNDKIIYNYWEKKKYFNSLPDNRLSYVVIMPPPNITGVLHMGHILNNTIQDVLTRKARLEGFNTCWVPGLDHASIATEHKLITELKKKGISKEKIGLKIFLKLATKWKLKYSKTIIKQLKQIGCSCDWQRLKFSLDDNFSKSVNKIFITLYKDGYLYKKYGIVNWDTKTQTALSNEEIQYKMCRVKLYYIKYHIQNDNNYIIVATRRPETIFADTALCVNPTDKRYLKYINKKVIVPISSKEIPIIADNYVDKKFCSGCVKITPAHDYNDKLIAERHNLEIINLIDKNGTLNKSGLDFAGKSVKKARIKIIEFLKKKNYLLKIKEYNSQIGYSERSNTEVEQLLSSQWFLKMNLLVKKALHNIHQKDIIKLYPKKIKKKIKDWFINLKDWNISRQLWWGHRIPECCKTDKKVEVLDTWFSAWIWPIVIFNGIMNNNSNMNMNMNLHMNMNIHNNSKYNYNNNNNYNNYNNNNYNNNNYNNNNYELQYYYPITELVTGDDILFFWVIRMIIAGFFFLKKKPFKNIYFNGIVKDSNRLKMSKSLGNSPNINKIFNKYGADSVRCGILIMAPIGKDMVFNPETFLIGNKIKNKIWNAFKLILTFNITPQKNNIEINNYLFSWIKTKFYLLVKLINKLFKKYKLSKVLIIIYTFFKKDFCSLFLESTKRVNSYKLTYSFLKKISKLFRNILIIFHPFIPFMTEYIWSILKLKNNIFHNKKPLLIQKWPTEKKLNRNILNEFKIINKIILQIRKFREIYKIYKKIKILVFCNNKKYNKIKKNILILLGNLKSIKCLKQNKNYNKYYTFILDDEIYLIKRPKEIFDRKKIKHELSYYKNYLDKIILKLKNSSFLKKAPKKIINLEKQKKRYCLNKINLLKFNLTSIK
ncbi:class I tRNA ligase family protein [Candidatus Karelsulcia muelleri]